MRLNKWIAAHSLSSRRKADELIIAGRVAVNGHIAKLGTEVEDTDTVEIDSKRIGSKLNKDKKLVVLLNKPIGYVCSRRGQGAPTIYKLLPLKLHTLDIAGRLDKDSSGLVILTNDGTLAQSLTHPSYQKLKVYTVSLDKPLISKDQLHITTGVSLPDGVSALKLKSLSQDKIKWLVTMHEGRNRQIRRTFELIGYKIIDLHRISVGDYSLGDILPKQHETRVLFL